MDARIGQRRNTSDCERKKLGNGNPVFVGVKGSGENETEGIVGYKDITTVRHPKHLARHQQHSNPLKRGRDP